MRIGGFMKNTFVDYPAKVACIVFTEGCNFNCWYCHNYELIDNTKYSKIEEKEIFEFLSMRKGLIDGVVVSGGEPTLQVDLYDFIKKIKTMGFLVKLDTNGTNPNILQKLIAEKLLDYIAMDIKYPLEKYAKVCCKKLEINEIKKSIEIIKNSGVDYEFRTTFVPELSLQDIEQITKSISPAKAYFLQVFQDDNIKNINIQKKHSKQEILNAMNIAKKNIPNTNIRGI